ncbi:MAG: LPD38 domain-containing protein [Kiritimatiellia bacterium]|nr:LPD38 domain-containing protein [Kiritimatiellia bacterium]
MPAFVINAVFGSLVKSAKQGNREARVQIDNVPPEILPIIEQTQRQREIAMSKGEIPLAEAKPGQIPSERLAEAPAIPEAAPAPVEGVQAAVAPAVAKIPPIPEVVAKPGEKPPELTGITISRVRKPSDSFYSEEAPKGWRIFSEQGNRWAHFDDSGKVVIKGEKGNEPTENELLQWGNLVRERESSWLSKLPKKVYIRFGNIPKSGKSVHWETGKKEKGISVYTGKIDWSSGTVSFDPTAGREGFPEIPAAALLRASEQAPVYLVSGDRIGYGSDNEPILRNVKTIHRLKGTPEGFISTEQSHLPPPAPTIPEKIEAPTLAPAEVTVTQQIPESRAGEVVKSSGFKPTDTYFNTPALKQNKTYAWRAMGEKEYQKLITGEKKYGAGAQRGQFFSPTPDGARQHGETEGKYLVEFVGVDASGEGITGMATKENVTRMWQFKNEKWNEFSPPPLQPQPKGGLLLPETPKAEGALVTKPETPEEELQHGDTVDLPEGEGTVVGKTPEGNAWVLIHDTNKIVDSREPFIGEVPKGLEGDIDAIQKSITEGVDVRPPPGYGEEVGRTYPEGEIPAEARPAKTPQEIKHERFLLTLKYSKQGYTGETLQAKVAKELGEKPDLIPAEKAEELVGEMPIPEGMKRDVGLRNMAGSIGFGKQAKVEPDSPNVVAVDMQRVFDKQRQDVSDKLNVTWSKIKDEYLRKITAVDAPIMRRIAALPGGEKVVIDKVLSTGWAEKQSEDYGIIKKHIKEHLPYRLNNAFDDYLQARRTIEVSNLMRENKGIQPELFAEGELPEIIKSPEGKGAVPNRTWMEEFKRTHTPQEFQALELAAKRWDETIKIIRDEYLKEGLIDREFHDYLEKYHKAYSPRKFIQHIDPPTEINQGGKIVSISSSGLEALDTGSEKSLVNNSNYLLARVLATKEARIFKNRVNRSLYDFILANKDNPLGLRVETPMESGKTPASDMTRISVMIDGKQKTIVGPTELMQSWIQSDPQLNRQTSAIIQWLMGGKIVKPLATGYSPFFALRNPFRDFAHYWFVTDEWSPHKPLTWVQQSRDIKDVWNDVMHEGPLVKLYFKTGGGTSFLSSQGRLGRDITGTSEVRNDAVDQVENAFAWLPRRSELLGRVALMNRAIKNRAKKNNITYEQALQNKDIVKEAVYVAKSALDFAQGGTLVKTLDNFKPYLNAAVQAGRTSVNAFRNRPLQTAYKSAQVMAFGAAKYFALYYLTNKAYEKGVEGQWDKYTGIENIKRCWDSISDADDAGNWTFPTPFFKMDRNGRKRYFYFRIPVEQTQQTFKVIGEEAAKVFMTGEKPNYKKLAQALSSFSPLDIQTLLPPTLAAVMGYASNKDFWTGQDIWKGRTVSPSVEYDADTPAGWKLTGKVTGLSPKRLQKSVSQVIPQNDYLSIFTGVTSAMQLAEDDTLNQKTWTILTKTPGLRAFFRVTQPTDLTEKDIEKAERYKIPTKYPDGEPMPRQAVMRKVNEKELDANTEKQLNDVHQDVLVRQIRDKTIGNEDMKKWIYGLDSKDERARLIDRLVNKYNFFRRTLEFKGKTPEKEPK